MSRVRISNVKLDQPEGRFDEPFHFEITFNCVESIRHDLQWKVIYVGSANSLDQDQTLEDVCVGPVPLGCNCFRLEAPAPDPRRIASADLVGITALLITSSFQGHEFARVGFYVEVSYDTPELAAAPPAAPAYDHLRRRVVIEHPRVTEFSIDWPGLNDQAPLFGDDTDGDAMMA